MPNPTRRWQLISLALAIALIATQVEVYRSDAAHPSAEGTLPTVNSTTNSELMVLSPNVRRVHERYSL